MSRAIVTTTDWVTRPSRPLGQVSLSDAGRASPCPSRFGVLSQSTVLVSKFPQAEQFGVIMCVWHHFLGHEVRHLYKKASWKSVPDLLMCWKNIYFNFLGILVHPDMFLLIVFLPLYSSIHHLFVERIFSLYFGNVLLCDFIFCKHPNIIFKDGWKYFIFVCY